MAGTKYSIWLYLYELSRSWDLNPHIRAYLIFSTIDAYQRMGKNAYGDIFGRKKVYFLIPTPEEVGTWWDLNPQGFGRALVCHNTRMSFEKRIWSMRSEKGHFLIPATWSRWHLVGSSNRRFFRNVSNCMACKKAMVYIWREKVYFLIPTPEKVGTWWDLNITLFGRAKVQPHYAY